MVFWSGFIKKIKNAVTKERVDKLEQKINTNATNIELIEQDVETNTNDISTIRNNITSINSNINDLDNDVARIENSLTNTNNELDSLEARVNGYDDRINEANTKATNAEEQATRLGLTVSTNSTKIVALESKNTDLTSKVNTNTNDIRSLQGTVDGIIKLKYQQIDASRFEMYNWYNGTGGRTQMYRYPIPNLSQSKIVSITGAGLYIDGHNNRSIITFSTGSFGGLYLLFNVFGVGLNSEYNVLGRVYIWYYD